MSQQQPGAPKPLIIALRQSLVAVDPERGKPLWHHVLPRDAHRLFVVDRSVLVALGGVGAGSVLCFDVDTGQARGSVDIGFEPSAGIAHGGRLYLASQQGAACLTTDGILLWSAKVEMKSTGLLSSENHLVFQDASGREMGRAPVEWGTSAANAGLVLGELIAQPDLRD